jgi:hypothetical protein
MLPKPRKRRPAFFTAGQQVLGTFPAVVLSAEERKLVARFNHSGRGAKKAVRPMADSTSIVGGLIALSMSAPVCMNDDGDDGEIVAIIQRMLLIRLASPAWEGMYIYAHLLSYIASACLLFS